MADGTLLFKTLLDDSGITKGLTNIKNAAKTAFGVSAKAVAAVTGALSAGATAGVLYNSSIENYTTSFEVMTGSADKAVEVVEELKKIGASTPFELTGLADTTQLLMNYGFTADDAIDRMMMLGDISQGNAEKMTRIATAYGQMSSAGKVQLEDIKQMIEAGFNPLQEISQTTGETMESLYGRISKGTISVDEITASMQRSTAEGGKYYQSMEKQSQTFSGQISTLKDNAQMLLGEVVQPISDSMVNTLIPAAISSIDELSAAFQQNGVDGLVQTAGTMIAAFVTAAAEYAPQMVGLAVQLIGALVQGIIDNLPQLLEATGEIASTILDGIGDLCPAIEPVTDALQYLIDHFDDFIPVIASVVAAIVAFKVAMEISAVVAAVSGAISKLSAAYAAAALKQEGLTVAQWLLNAAMSANPVMLVVIAIMALVAVLVYLWNTNEDFRTGITETWNGIIEAVRPVIEKMGELFSMLVEPLKGVIDFLLGILAPVFEGVFKMIGTAVEGFLGIFEGVLDFIIGVFSGDWERAWQGIKEIFGGIWKTMTASFEGIWETITSLFGDGIESIKEWFASLPGKITDWLSSLGETVSEAMSSAWDSIVSFFTESVPAFIESIGQWFSSLPEKIMYWFGFLLTSIALWGIELVNWAITAIPEFINNVITFFSELPGKIAEWLTNTIQKIVTWGSEMAAKAAETGEQFLSNLITFFSELPGNIATWLKNVISKVLTFVTDMGTKAKEAGKGFFDNIVSALSELPEKMVEIGSNIVSGIWNGIKAGWDWLIGGVKDLANSLFQGAKDALDIHSPSKKFKWLGEMCVEGMDEPLATYNPYDTLSSAMQSGVLSAKLIKGDYGISGVADGVKNTVENMRAGISGMTGTAVDGVDYGHLEQIIYQSMGRVGVYIEGKPAGKVLAPYINNEMGRITERRT